ncbi:MAG TPA: response regulator [Caulobacteraceae bacterium]|jgi:DNA-binding response OmpR family regulator
MTDMTGPTARVLVVEDEPEVCDIIQQQLGQEGYEVVCACNDDMAYQTLQTEARSFKALIIDINLGKGTTGFDVARHARRLNPAVPVVYVTGGDPSTVETHGVAGAALVLKPFDREDLLGALQTVN